MNRSKLSSILRAVEDKQINSPINNRINMVDSLELAREQQNQQARQSVLSQVSPAQNLAAPSVSFESARRLLIIGPEHRIRLASARLDTITDKVGLVTEAMPATMTDEMDAAAELIPELQLYQLPLTNIDGYLGRFSVTVGVEGNNTSLAKLAFGVEYFDSVLDLNDEAKMAVELKPAGYFAPTDQHALEAALQTLPSLKGGFEKPRYFTLDNDVCAHSGSGLTGCTRCLDICPADAIQSIKGMIQVDSYLCHGAGGCATVCPTSAIRYGYPQPRLVLDALQRMLQQYAEAGGETPCLLIHDAERGRSLVDLQLEILAGQWLPLQIEEMGSAGLEVWLTAIALGVADVVLLVGEQLPETIDRVLVNEIGVANTLLGELSLQPRVRLIADFSSMTEVSSRQPVTAMEVVDLEADKRSQISQAMAHLQQQSDVLPAVVDLPVGAAFGGLLIEEKNCTLCMSCVAICPSQALQSEGTSPLLNFTEDHCVQCGLCNQACPEDALTLQPRYLLDAERRIRPQILKKEEPFCCIRCSEPFATQGMVALMLEKLAGHSMFDEAGLNRLKMCADCRVADAVLSDPGGDLLAYAKGRSAEQGDVNLTQQETRTDEDIH